MDISRMRTLVDEARVARLATVGADGAPHLVPISFALIGDVVYHAVDHKPKRSHRLRRIVNIEATARVCVLVDSYDEDWTRLWWVRLDGTGRVVTDLDEASRAVMALAARYPQYVDRPPSGPVIAVDVTRWSGWSASPAP
jgi:PPOX class probable F420-dependent enzyme